MKEEEDEGNNRIKTIAFIVAVVLISVALIWFVGGMLSEPIEPPKKTVQEVKLFRPPPPPEIEEEPPPPEEEIEEEVELEEPEEIPDVPDAEPPPGSQLGLDAEGGAGSDAFGLVGNKGGRSLLGSGSGNRFAWYANIIKTEILDSLYEDEKLRSKSYRIRCDIWLSKSGEVARIKILNSTGDTEIDNRIKEILNSLKRISDAPPADMNMPIKLAIESR